MARYSVETRDNSEQILKKAEAFFGKAGLGLEVVEQNPCCVSYEGGGGYVSVTVAAAGKKTLVDLETREWDYQVRDFVRQLS